MDKQKRWLLLLFTMMFLMISSVPVLANNQNIINYNQTNVTKGQTVENLVVIGNNVVIEGHVKDAVIVINGNLTVRQTAQIQGIIVVLGGSIQQEQGAKISDHVLNLSFREDVLNSLLLAISIIVGLWFIKFGLSLLLILLISLISFLIKKRLSSIDKQIKESPKRLTLIGIASSVLLLALGILLTITVIGIPIVIILLIVVLFIFLVSLAACSNIIGEYLLRKKVEDWRVPVVGAMAIVAGMNFQLFGGFLFLILLWISLGVMTLWFFDWIKHKRKNQV